METKKLGRPRKLAKVKLVSFGLDPLDFTRLQRMAKKLGITIPDLMRKICDKRVFNKIVKIAIVADIEKDGVNNVTVL